MIFCLANSTICFLVCNSSFLFSLFILLEVGGDGGKSEQGTWRKGRAIEAQKMIVVIGATGFLERRVFVFCYNGSVASLVWYHALFIFYKICFVLVYASSHDYSIKVFVKYVNKCCLSCSATSLMTPAEIGAAGEDECQWLGIP